MREVLMHVIVDTATHAGQLDAVRERRPGPPLPGRPV
ncbi:mycothiol transferase [Streptosporangium sandarakinum]